MNISEGAKIVGPPHSLDLLLCPSITGSWPSVGDVWNWFPTKCTDFQIVSIFIKLTVFIQHTHYTLTNSNNASILGTEVQRVACLQWIECQQIWNWYENLSCRLLKDQIYLLLNSSTLKRGLYATPLPFVFAYTSQTTQIISLFVSPCYPVPTQLQNICYKSK